jgi:hypothetical protein
MQELAEVYQYLAHEKEPPPSRLEDLRPYEASMPNAWPAIEGGQYVVFWGVGLSGTPEAANTVLAYDKDAPTQGGAVLMRNGTVKTLTAQEFQAAPKARR